MKETANYYENIQTKTATKIGAKTVNVKNFNKDKSRITVILKYIG